MNGFYLVTTVFYSILGVIEVNVSPDLRGQHCAALRIVARMGMGSLPTSLVDAYLAITICELSTSKT